MSKCNRWFREDSISGRFFNTHGQVDFSEDYDGDNFVVEIYNSSTNEFHKVNLSREDIKTIALIGMATECFDLDEIEKEYNDLMVANNRRNQEVEEIRSQPIDLDAAYDEAHRPLNDIYGDQLVGGGDGTPEYYAVEGWGVQKLDTGDFEVTYKV